MLLFYHTFAVSEDKQEDDSSLQFKIFGCNALNLVLYEMTKQAGGFFKYGFKFATFEKEI